MELKLITLNTIKRFFEGLTSKDLLSIRKICSDCGCEFTIEIHKTTDGFGIQGGALYDEDGIIVAKCVGCYNKPK